MKVLITGGAGFIGSHTVDCAIQAGLDVVVVDNMSTGKEANLHPACKLYRMDVASTELRNIFELEQPDYCIHLAEKTDLNEAMVVRGLSPNLRGLIYLLDLCKEFSIKKLVYGSSAEVYGSYEPKPIDEAAPCAPVSCTGMSKLAPEEYIKLYGALYGLNYTILRYANVYGCRQKRYGSGGVISAFLETFVNGEKAIIQGKGLQTRDFVYVSDVASANVQALSLSNSDTYNIGTGTATSILELFELMNEMTNQKVKPVFVTVRPEDHLHVCVSWDKAAKGWGWSPRIQLREGLTQLMGDFMYQRLMDKINGVQETAPEPVTASMLIRRMAVKKSARRLKTSSL